ncbi:MAG: NHL repeat-containing protein [Candidatus Aminicenantes bacterium]|nr:NHL repeat-containing protein [Candidatus Aminicenantes bacterium]
MKKIISLLGTVFFLLCSLPAVSQQTETKDGIRIIHNDKTGPLPGIELRLVRTIGGLEETDENLAFGLPYDVDLDSAGNIYVLDTRNDRIQKLDPDGKFLRSIGRRGQGPGEFQAIFSFDIDVNDRLHVFDVRNRRIQILTTKGRVKKTLKVTSSGMSKIRVSAGGDTILAQSPNFRDLAASDSGLPKLIKRQDEKGHVKAEFGDMRDYGDDNVNVFANWLFLDMDNNDNIYLTFWYQNRIDKYAPDGTLLWRSDRKLNYKTEVIDKGYIKRGSGGTTVQTPEMNTVSEGLAADSRGRLWVITLNRQMSREEQGSSVSVGGQRKVMAEPKIKSMDIYKLEVFNSDGKLMGELPLDHFAHGIRIVGDNLFIWERNNAAVYQYKIVEE